MSNLQFRQIKSNEPFGSGRVRYFILPDTKIKITQITTFCPDIFGPGATHLYLIEKDSVILVDTGIPTSHVKNMFFKWRRKKVPSALSKLPDDQSYRELLEGLASVGHSIKDIDALVITHGHPDHFLNGPLIMERGDPRVLAHILDLPEITSPWGTLRNWVRNRGAMASFGMPAPFNVIDEIVKNLDPESLTSLSLNVDTPIMREGPFNINGSKVEGITIGHFPGHTPGSIGLIVASDEWKVLLCGDVLLYPITPSPDNLLVYLRTLQDLKRIRNIGLVLPAHGKIFHDIKSRVDFLERHHQKRLKKTYHACRDPKSIWDIASMPNYFDTYVNPKQYNPLAGLEALAHVEVLKMVDGLYRPFIRDGVHYFENSGERFEDVYGRILELVDNRKITTIMRY